MEYLMTYGWAIIIIIVTVAALYGMGVFTAKPTVPCTPCFTSFAYVDHNLTHLLINNGPREIIYTGTVYAPGETIIIEHECATWPCEITVNYIVKETGVAKSDSAKLHPTW